VGLHAANGIAWVANNRAVLLHLNDTGFPPKSPEFAPYRRSGHLLPTINHPSAAQSAYGKTLLITRFGSPSLWIIGGMRLTISLIWAILARSG